MEQLKKSIRKNTAGRKMTDQFYVDGDVNVPDTRSDVGKIVCSQGRLKIDDMKLVENYVRVSGKVLYQILYVIDGGGQRMSSIQGKLPFEEMVYTEEEPKGALFLKEGNVELSASLIHSRKLSLKAIVDLELSSECEEEDLLTLDVEDEPGLYKKWESRELLKYQMTKKDTCRVKEEFELPGTAETVGNVLFTEVSQRKFDTRLGTDELLIRGELLVFVLYESPDGKTDWTEQTVTYEGRMECPGVDDTMYYHLVDGITDENIDIRMDEDGEMRIIGVEAAIEVRVTIFSEEKMDILKDIYSLQKELSPQMEETEGASMVMQKTARYKMSEQLSVPELKNGILQICHTGGDLKIEHTEIVAEGIMAEGVVTLFFLYVREDDEAPFEMWQGMVPFTYVIECAQITADMQYDLSGSLEQLGVGLLGNGEAEVKASIGFRIFIRKPEKILNIERIETKPVDWEALSAAPGIVGYIVKDGDELWDLGKRYHTTAEGIMSVNQMENDSLKPGEKILIFKENIGIL